MSAIKETNYHFPNQREFYRGKVRDVYHIGNDLLVMVASDRISAFDHVLPKPIPFKGQVLNQVAANFLHHTADIAPNWMIAVPDANVTIGVKCAAIPVEMVIRGYLSGHAWRQYQQGIREICGVKMPDGMRESDAFPEPIITPATKAAHGHDEDISREEILKQGIVKESVYVQLEDFTRRLYQRGAEMAAARGLLLVDTKYEFGTDTDGQVRLIDEIHTPDSSRYFEAEGYAERQQNGLPQRQLSKEFVRQWLIANGFQGLDGQEMPTMPDDFVSSVSDRYIELYEKITGSRFVRADTDHLAARIEANVVEWLMSR